MIDLLTFEKKTLFLDFLYHYGCYPGITRQGKSEKGDKFQFVNTKRFMCSFVNLLIFKYELVL